ncbi:MAG TPA: helix-turn-helix domain-containing protein, partial [Solirubrobacteraceae bacterium]|nr:helix-turn-helix domain-containing protein [Solirubrobacteraceae bacterium]
MTVGTDPATATAASRQAQADLPIAGFSIAPSRRIAGIAANTIARCALPEPGWAHRHTFNMIVYITRGRGAHVIDCHSYPLRAGALYFLRPHQVHLWDYQLLPSGYTLSFSEEVLRAHRGAEGVSRDAELFDDLAEAARLQLTPVQARAIRPLVDEMVREYQEAGSDYSSVMQAYLHVLLARAHRLLTSEVASNGQAGRMRPLVRRFIELVAQSQGAQHRVCDYSDALGVTPSHLAEAVREVTGRTPGQIIREAEVAEARRLLGHTEKTVAQIAHELGFKDSAYFGRFFKRETG